MAVIELKQDNFEQEVIKSDKPVLIDFWASWCGPCKMMSPIVDSIANERPDLKVGKVNIDEQNQLAEQFKIMSIPTLLYVKDGQVVDKFVGTQPKETILQKLK